MPGPTDSELNRLFERTPIGMYRSTADGRFLFVNPALAKMLGYSIDELLTLNLSTDIYAEPGARVGVIAQYKPRGVVDGAHVRWRTRDGKVLHVRIFGHIHETIDGTTFDASVLDVTDIEEANAKVRDQSADLERTATILDMVVRQMPALYWIVDRELRIVRTGGAVTEVLGYAPDTYLGVTLHDVSRHDPDAVATLAYHGRALAGETLSYTGSYRGKTLATTLAPHRVDGEIVGAIGTAIDVTAARALERRMVDAQRAESLGVLAGGLAHDFNNLLVAILGNADLGLRDTPAGAPGRYALENIRHASLRAAELTDQLLAYAGHGGVPTTRVEPAPVVEELLRISAPTLPPNVQVHTAISPELALQGEAAQFRQVMLNLIANGRDALRERGGSVMIRGSKLRHDGDPHNDDVLTPAAGSYVLIEVSDNGPGIDGETRRRIFEPFFTTKQTGHGLGLAAVLGIVRSHGGGLRLVSTPGAGASFQVMWPMVAAPTGLAPRTTARTVLVIDDEDLVRDVVARMIEDLGYAAITASDGPAGLELIDGETVDAVLVDLTMPRMSGVDVVAALRARRPDLPIILCTGYDRERRGPVQADAYLPKPFRIEALEQTLAKLLR